MHKRSIRFASCQLERSRLQHRARELDELLPSYGKLATFEKFMGELQTRNVPGQYVQYYSIMIELFIPTI